VGQAASGLDLTKTAVREWVKQAREMKWTRRDGGLSRPALRGESAPPAVARLP
jgi:hypothetical protein